MMPSYRRVTYRLLHRTFTVVECHTPDDLEAALSDLDPFQSHWWQLSLPEAADRLSRADRNPRTPPPLTHTPINVSNLSPTSHARRPMTMPATPVHKPTLIAHLIRAVVEFRRHANDSTGLELDVRLYVEPGDQSWWVSTGSVQYDTLSAGLCAASTLCVYMSNDEIIEVATSMLSDIDDQAAEFSSEAV